jgi:hypothetical protein
VRKTFIAIPLALLVLAVAGPALAQDEYPGYKPDPNGPDAGSYSSSKGSGLGEWQDKSYSWSIKLGAQLDFLPGQFESNNVQGTFKTDKVDAGFALAFANEYHFYKPLWLQVSTILGVNGRCLDWGLQVGLLLKILPGHFTPTFRGAIAFDWKTYWDDLGNRSTSNFALGGSFGPGMRFILGDDMDKAIFIDLDVFVGKFLKSFYNNDKELYVVFTPMVGFEF